MLWHTCDALLRRPLNESRKATLHELLHRAQTLQKQPVSVFSLFVWFHAETVSIRFVAVNVAAECSAP